MSVNSIVVSAFRNLQRGPLRAALTTLGVVVGVAAVVTTTSIGNGAKEKIAETLATPESRAVYLGVVARNHDGSFSGAELASSDNLNERDYDAIRHEVEHIAATSLVAYMQNARARTVGRVANVILEGVDTGAFVITQRTILQGALLNPSDIRRATSVCVISESLARKLYGEGSAVGRPIQLNGTTFTVIGVVDDAQSGGTGIFSLVDLHAYVPYTSLLRRLNPNASISVGVQVVDVEHVGSVQDSINNLMALRRGGRRSEFLTSNSIDSVRAYSESALAVARLLAAIGGISLISGGIGIMNVMIIGVAERTREIGIRMAVGTRARSILLQFLLEAVALGVLGGVIGVLVGVVTSQIYARLNGWPMTTTPGSVATALFCSLAVGVLSGIQPARRAAGLSPVSAIRNEA